MGRDEFWGEIAGWLEGLLAGKTQPGALVVGLSAPQGAGKTTLTREVCRRLADKGIRAVTVSIDDFYLTHDEQVALSQQHPGNRYLAHRGLPGTHDIGLGVETIRSLRRADVGEVRVPSYDKSQFAGKGDRAPAASWPMVTTPLDLVLVEGWMLGFRAIAPTSIADPAFRVVNDFVPQYMAWTELLDAFIWIEAEDATFVRTWRAEAETAAIAAGKAGMTPEQVQAFVAPFLTAYETYLPGLAAERPITGPYLHFQVGKDRLPITP